jgi:hypothetical protein
MSLNKVLAFGHSHLGALSAAYEQAKGRQDLPYELTTYQFLSSDRPQMVNPDDKGWRYHPEIERDIRELTDTFKPQAIVIMMHGEQAVSAGLIVPTKPYDFYFPQEIGYVPNAAVEIISFDLLFKMYIARYHMIADFIDLIRDRLPPLSFALSPPPLVGDRQFIIDSDTKHGNISCHIKKHGLSTTAWRLRIWKINTMAMRTVYKARAIEFIDPPNCTTDENGCLRLEYRADVFHANAAYGQLLLQQIGHFFGNKISELERQET